MRLIDADELLKEFESYCRAWNYDRYDGNFSMVDIERGVGLMPTIDPVRHGRWIPIREADETGNAQYECSVCHAGETHVPIVEVPFCWKCGASMDGGEE